MSKKLEELRERFEAHKDALERWSRWCPNRPWPKQREFAQLTELEALYGGAAGGGKTDALLAAALEHVDTPGYSAIYFRRSFTDLSLDDAPMDRAKKWLAGTDAVWNETAKKFTFPTGARLQFAYCQNMKDVQRYKSAAFHCICVDELTEWPLAEYTYLFSRIRRKVGTDAAAAIPLRMRAATNPDGPGYGWVRERFTIPENTRVDAPIRATPKRVFYPARLEDNPSLDGAAYEASLEELAGGRGGVKWKQLRDGLWIPDGAGLVYVYRSAKNKAPPLNWKRERARWHFVLGVDYGYTNACGFAVLGWRDGDPNVYVMEAHTVVELLPTEAAVVVRDLDKVYAFEKMVGDMGGLGKPYVEEGRRRWTLPIEPAQKQNKRGYQTLFNDSLSHGHIQLVEELTEDLRQEWAQLPWSEDGKEEMPGFANHAADATLYAWRECPNYHERMKDLPPTPGSPEALAAEEKRLEDWVDEEMEEENQRERHERVHGKSFWR